MYRKIFILLVLFLAHSFIFGGDTLHMGVHVVTLDNKKVSERNAKEHFVPASNTKLFTAAAALHYLGKNFCFETNLYSDGTNLYLKGSADPSLTLEAIAHLLKDRPEKRLLIDLSLFDDHYYGPGWMIGDIDQDEEVPITALYVKEIKTKWHPAEELLQRLQEQFHLSVALGVVPPAATIVARHKSMPLQALVKHMLKISDNIYADYIFKRLGANQPFATWQQAQEAMKQFVQQALHIPPDQIKIEDGSGLSRYNLISPEQITRLLIYKKNDRAFVDALPIGGVDGTLKNRFIGTILQGKIHAKTGTMTGVSSLSGYLHAPNHRTYVFSILIDDFPEGSTAMRELQDKICLRIALDHSR